MTLVLLLKLDKYYAEQIKELSKHLDACVNNHYNYDKIREVPEYDYCDDANATVIV